jgi:predicted ATP-dependent endonuclease of OLD family
VLEQLASNGWTIVTATHAPEMISFAKPQMVARLWRRPDGVGKGELRTTDAGSHATFQERLDERGGHEMLFAQRAVLCEGKDDVFAIRLFLNKRGFDLDGRGVSIINAGDVGATIETPCGRMPSIRSVWFVEAGQDIPCFVTAYPLEGAD